MLKLPQGYESYDPDSKQQALNIALTDEVERLQKVIDGVNLVNAGLENRLKELEGARQRQISFNSDVSKLVFSIAKEEEKLNSNANNAGKGVLANLIKSFFRRK